MAVLRSKTMLGCGIIVFTSWVLYRLIRNVRKNAYTTRLRGPKSPSLLFGVSKLLAEGDGGVYFEQWAKEYGTIYQIPTILGTRRTIIFDPKAIAHFYSREAYGYRMQPFLRQGIKNFIGEGLLYAEADDHKRQRMAMTPAFSNTAIRNFVPVFYDSAYKVKAAWDAIFDSDLSADIVVDVQYWMNRVSMDSLGIAAFSHDFESLHGKSSAIIENFDAFAKYPMRGFDIVVFLLTPFFPILLQLPGKRQEVNRKYRETVLSVADELLQKTRADKMSGDLKHDASKSIIGALVQVENAEGHRTLSEKEVRAQMEVLIMAGYESTSISMTWALIELCYCPEKQAILRKELMQLSPEDPTYEQLMGNLPYLDAVLREILRLHPPVDETTRIAYADDILPLAYPIETANGKRVETLSISEGELVTVPIKALNMSESIWGEDAKKFVPERWINKAGLPEKVKELPGYHHLLTFVEGTRMCIGRHFAVAEFKAALSVLIKNYEFSFRDGPDSNPEFKIVRTIMPRPKLKGEVDISVPLRIRRAEAI